MKPKLGHTNIVNTHIFENLKIFISFGTPDKNSDNVQQLDKIVYCILLVHVANVGVLILWEIL